MDNHAAPVQTLLFVELSGVGIHHVFELDSDERAFLVGSSRQADLWVDHPGVAAVEFHIERAADEAWLVPAYRGRRLRVNGVPTTTSVRLTGRALVALGPVELELKVLHHEDEAGTTNRSSSAPRPLPLDYAATIPTDTAQTAVAMKPFESDPSANLPTQQIAVLRSPPALNQQQTERLAPVRPHPLQFAQLTERLAPVAAPTAPGGIPSQLETQHTQRLAPLVTPPMFPVAAPAPAVSRIPVLEIRPIGPQPAPEAAKGTLPAPLAAQETTSFDVAAIGAPAPAAAPIGAPRVALAPAAPKTTQANGARASSPRKSLVNELLIQLGALTKKRPVVVLGGGLASAIVLALALVGATRVTEPKRTAVPPSQPTATTAVPKPTMSAVPAVPAVAVPAVVAVAPPPPPAEAKPAPRAAKGPHDLEVAAAVGHLSAGRIAEAAKAYGALASRPTGGDAYAKTATLLTRRASSCSGGSPSQCPEVLK